MGTLNVVNKSPFEKQSLAQCLKRIGEGDSVLLIEDAAVSAVAGTAVESQLLEASKNVQLFVLQPDLEARGFTDTTLVGPVKRIDYAGFVDLVVTHDRVHSWL